MEKIVTKIEDALLSKKPLSDALADSELLFKKDFPIAYLHLLSRAENEQTQKILEDIFNETKESPIYLSQDTYNRVLSEAKSYMQTVAYACFKYEPKKRIEYKNRHQNDYWKKIQSVEHMSAVFEVSAQKNEKLCEAEFTLREVIRKRKEVHSLKSIGFIWMVESTEDLRELFKHYFGEKYKKVHSNYYIGYSDTLKEINMRYFVCPPQEK